MNLRHLVPEVLYLRGSFNGWGDDTPMTYMGNNLYCVTFCLTADRHQFKISDTDATELLTFSGDKQKTVCCDLDIPLTLMPAKGIGNDLILDIKQTDLYTLVLDLTCLAAPILTITLSGENMDAKPNRAEFHVDVTVSSSPDVNLVGKGAPILSPQALFEAMVISEQAPFPFVFGDNVDGYYEGITHSYVAAGKYRHKQGWYLGTFASLINGHLLDKTKAREGALYPYGITHRYQHGQSDTLSIFSGKRMAALRVESKTMAILGAIPILNIAINQSAVSVLNGCVVYSLDPSSLQPDSPSFLAICVDQPYRIREQTLASLPELGAVMHLSQNHLKLVIETLQPTKAMTVYLAFAMSEAEAVKTARDACQHNDFARHCQSTYDMLTNSYLWTSDPTYNMALMWAKAAGKVFVSREFGAGIWAGLPWFKDCWGRDSFIALPGITLTNGDFAEAKKIITNFALMQQRAKDDINYGRIPNRVSSATNIIYNTADGTPWMVREIGEYLRYSGDMAFAKEIYPVVKAYIDGVETHYLDKNGLMTHRQPDTWMDAKWQGEIPWSARGNRANDIQALWFTSLKIASELATLTGDEAGHGKYTAMADKVQQQFQRLFWDENRCQMADRINENGKADYRVRPNQLMTLSVPFTHDFVNAEVGAYVVKNAVSELLFPWGICSLSQLDKWFHPYHNERNEYHKDAAYHNGTIWGWNAGFTVSAMLQYGEKELAYQLTKNLAEQILTLGHRGAMSENLDAFPRASGQLVTSGTYAQAWSVSEFHRNGYQDYLGFRPDALNGRVSFIPQFPDSWLHATAVVPFGNGKRLSVTFKKQAEEEVYQLSCTQESTQTDPQTKAHIELEFAFDTEEGNRQFYNLMLTGKVTLRANAKTGILMANNEIIAPARLRSNHKAIIGTLAFAAPNREKKFAALSGHNLLETEILSKQYDINLD